MTTTIYESPSETEHKSVHKLHAQSTRPAPASTPTIATPAAAAAEPSSSGRTAPAAFGLPDAELLLPLAPALVAALPLEPEGAAGIENDAVELGRGSAAEEPLTPGTDAVAVPETGSVPMVAEPAGSEARVSVPETGAVAVPVASGSDTVPTAVPVTAVDARVSVGTALSVASTVSRGH